MPYKCRQELRTLTEHSSTVESLALSSAFRVSSPLPGPRVTVLGGIHGDEPAGFHTIKEVIRRFTTGEWVIAKGTLTLAIGNEEAVEKGVRKIEHDLNRLFRDQKLQGDSYEERRAEELKSLLKSTDFLLDLHQTSAPSEPFIMCEKPFEGVAAQLGVKRVVVGWGELGDASLAADTETYCIRHGGTAFTMENGHGAWEGGNECALRVTQRFLEVVGTIASQGSFVEGDPSRFHRMIRSERCRSLLFKYSKSVASFVSFAGGEEIGRDEIGAYVAPQDCVIVMPTPEPRLRVGEDLFFLATDGLP